MDVYIARQPIFDRKKVVFAYELLFRDSLSNYFPRADGDKATSKVLSGSLFAVGMERITGEKKAFINFTQNILSSDIPFMFPSATTVIEILEDVKPDPSIIEACGKLSAAGYHLALDDYFPKSGMLSLVKLANIIKMDFRAMTVDEIQKIIRDPEYANIKFLAEKIETYEEFKSALEMGFEYFQGYFFSKPEIIKGSQIADSALQLLNLVVAISKPEVNMDELEKIVEHDVSLSYKLLRYVNSASLKRRAEISSIRKALMVIGLVELKRMVSLILLSQAAVNKPEELIKSSCIKARFCEGLGHASTSTKIKSELFLLGLFAHIDAILDQPMSMVMENIPVSKNISDALVNGEGEALPYLKLAECYERGDWDNVKKYASQVSVKEDSLPDIYAEACQWANEFVY
ncbi:MAG: HDOD domain-containing protein [Nitrospirae bacterium]|nr:HDOD domain-containing protein [Nitrospirota bacterium]